MIIFSAILLWSLILQAMSNLTKILNETPDTSKINDNNVAYFDYKNCQNTYPIHSNQENYDPNVETDICKNCKANQLFQSTLSEGAIESGRKSKSIRSPHSPAAVAEFDETNMSPLTSNLGDVGSSREQLTSCSPASSNHSAKNVTQIRAVAVSGIFITSINWLIFCS
jgi:hypothetical protein